MSPLVSRISTLIASLYSMLFFPLLLLSFSTSSLAFPFSALLSSLSRFSSLMSHRFMDTGKTNGNNIVQWTDRTLTTSITQDLEHPTPTIAVASFADASSTASAYSGDWKVQAKERKRVEK